MKKYRYDVIDLDCANCAKKIEDKIAKTEGYKNVILNYSTLKLSFETDKENPLNEIREIVQKIEPDTQIVEEKKENTKTENESKKINMEIIRLIIGIYIAAIGSMGVFSNELINTLCIIAGYVILLFKTAKKALKLLWKNHSLDESALITISCIGAYLIGKQSEGLMVIALYEIGEILEDKAVNKSRKSIKELMNIKPEYANLKEKNETKKVSPEDVKIGDIIVVKNGEKIPLDGIVTKGNSSLNTAALTGESKLQNVKVGDKVLSGSINVEGLIEVKVTEKYENSTVSKVLQLVETATDRKAKTENFVSKAAKIYTPIVIGLAIIVAVFMPMVIKSVSYSESIYKALVFLVISCPCSIAISVPLSYFSGIGKSSKEGILVKGSDYLDGIKNIKEIIFDKTGTITTGKFEVVEVKTYGELNEEEVYKYFVYGEKFSNHPIAKSILEYKHIDIDESKVKNLKEISGKGILYEFEGKTIKIGNKELVEEKTNRENNGTALYLSVDGKVEGAIILKDKIKDNMKNTFEKFKKLGIKTRMFTGDRKEVAEEVASEVGIDEYKAEMLPQDKFNELEKVIESNKDENYKVAFVGDGINDSPVIARADIGISMGGVGASSAIEASDVVIMTDEIEKIITGIRISNKTNRIIKENLVFSIGIKILVLLLTILGISDMWEAVFADVGVTLITIFNTLRILK